ncbi:hypothetical protein HU200_015028 [Digitaria exilis]|uniref:Late embryogenesis abundant protein LEA-2 subgroup domain-containing protein n=1 Tax=Digitaria exilis TaxID=1010633 RepID=A0A835F9N6_9POAL|nr:hypothetical protein HU200_015028 [Digitaria exilis]
MAAAPCCCGDGGEGENKTPLWWLAAARYAIAFMVTVLIIIVIVKAIKVVSFPDPLYLSVVQGTIFAAPARRSQKQVQELAAVNLEFRLLIVNPTRHVPMYLVNVTSYLFDHDTPATTVDPVDHCFVYYKQKDDIAIRQNSEANQVLRLSVPRMSMQPKFFDLVYNTSDSSSSSSSMSGVTMRLDATLVASIRMSATGNVNVSGNVTYYFWPLVVLHKNLLGDLVDDDLTTTQEDLGNDVFCRPPQGGRFL